jgi:hypothetical protein
LAAGVVRIDILVFIRALRPTVIMVPATGEALEGAKVKESSAAGPTERLSEPVAPLEVSVATSDNVWAS